MSQALNDFCASLRDNPSCALNALLKIAEARQAILDWKQEVANTRAKDGNERDLKFIAVEHAMSLVDSAEESTATTSFEAAFPWDPSSPMTLTLGPIKSPLQELLLLRRSGEMMYPTGQSAWILICPSSSYVSTESAFREAISLTQEWAAQVDSSARTIFLRAYLGHISAQCR